MGLTKVKIDNFNPTPRIDEYTLRVGRVIVAWFLWFMFAAAAVLFLVSRAEAQNTMAPFKTQQVNTTYYVGQASLTTIQKAVTAACASAPGGRVVIQAGITPPDTIGAVTGGCTKAPIVDERALPDACFTWNGSAYAAGVCATGTGTPPVVAGSSQYANRLATAPISGGQFNSDAFNTANNGVAAAQALGLKNLLIPSTSTTTENVYGGAVTLDGTHLRDERNLITDFYNNPLAGSDGPFATGNKTICLDSHAPPTPGTTDHTLCHHFILLSSESGIDVTGQPTLFVGDSFEAYFLGNGIHQAHGTLANCYTDDDCGIDYTNAHIRAANLAGASEGNVLSSKQGNEDPTSTGVIVAGGAGATTVSFGSLAGSQVANSAYLIFPTENIARGTLLTATPGAGLLISSYGTTDTHLVSTGYGFLTADCGTNNVANNPQPSTCPFTTGTFAGNTGFGSFTTGTLVAIADWRNFECSTATVSGGNITLNFARTHPAGTPIYQGVGTCADIMQGRGYSPVWTATDGFTPNYYVAGARTATSWDLVFPIKNGQNGQQPIGIFGPLFATITSASQSGTTVTLTLASAGGQFNNYTAPSGTSICVSGNSNANFNICGIAGIVATNAGFTLTYTHAPIFAGTGTGGIINVGTVAAPASNGLGNYEIDCGTIVTKILGQDPAHLWGNGSANVQANNCTMAAGETFVQPNNPAQSFLGSRVSWIAHTPNPLGANGLNEWTVGGIGFSGGLYASLNSEDPISAFQGYGGEQFPRTFLSTAHEPGIGTLIDMPTAPIGFPGSNNPDIGGVFASIGGLPVGGIATKWDLFRLGVSRETQLRFDPVTHTLNLQGDGNQPNLNVTGNINAGGTVNAGTGLTGEYASISNLLSDATHYPLTIGEQFNGGPPCRGILFHDTINNINTGSMCSTADGGGNRFMNFHVGQQTPIPLALVLKQDASLNQHAIFTGDITTPSASVLASTTTNDLAFFDNATGHLADSGILKGALVLLNAANQFDNSTQSFGLTGSGQTQISNAGIKGINTALAQTYFLSNATGVGTFAGFGTNTNCSSAASPAVCGAAAAGSVVIATSATSVTVNTTAVTANSQILITPDASLGAKLGVTCNSTTSVALAGFGVTARVAGTSFTLSTLGTVATNPACYSYSIIN